MIVLTADIVRVAVLEPEGDSILVVDANAVSASLIALERFEMVAGNDA